MIFSKKQYLFFILAMAILIFISYFYIDKNISMYFIKNADTFKSFGKTMSVIGESHWYIGIAIFGALYYSYAKKNAVYKFRFLFLLYANIFSGLISLICKMFFGRLRPWKLENGGDGFGFLIAQNSDFTIFQNIKYQISMLTQDMTQYTSFPSGHATTMFALFTYISILFPKYIYLWLSMAIFGGMLRVFANDHFISDVLAGATLGVISTLFIYSKMKDKIEKHY